MTRDYRDYFNDILNSIDLIEDFIKNLSLENFQDDPKTSSAVIRQIEVLGEAVKNIPEEIKGKYPDIPWKRMAGMGDKLIHEYFGVDLEIVWTACKEKLPPLKPLIKGVLTDIEKNNDNNSDGDLKNN